ncbi:MAG: Glu-tRNA(Gln) amidotransferase subunit GatE [Aigarchaeota archaeon]|nr:Glu-tRNA(Gln) amidotransferase subunit GatE [Candidatus Pelearchaeum maunauluense]
MIDYKEVGLKVGLEVHRQLDTSKKLFCDCPTEAVEGGRVIEFRRYLREAQSELGRVDPAALFEAKKRKEIIYQANTGNVCLVEMDEEPPHPINREAVEVALIASLLMGATPVDEVHVMRKIVIDGSNTTGFQRTCIIAVGGSVRAGEKEIPIQTITLEEDAARIVEARRREAVYDLSRLGVPLIEISTAPVIQSPEEAVKAAKAIGDILRATGKVKRGLGTVRQDLNISISGGALMEIKGVQELDLIAKVVENEVKRQLHLLEIAEELRRRGVRESDLAFNPVDVTEVFRNTSSKVVKRKLAESAHVFALRLPGFAGFLSLEKWPGIRLGAELAAHAKAWGDVEGIFHTDELPAYGISPEEVEGVKKALECGGDDAAVLVVSDEHSAIEALRAVLERAKEAIRGVPEETRAARPDGTTTYMRPRPGAARMYPETDIPPMTITQEYIESLRRKLPPTLEETAKRLQQKYNLSRQLIQQLIDQEVNDIFEHIVEKYGVQPSVVAATLTETLTSLRREGVAVDELPTSLFDELFQLLKEGVFAKEAIRDILAWVAANRGKSVVDAVNALNVRAPSREELEKTIDELIAKNQDMLNDKKIVSRLMGDLMKVYRGRVDGAVLNKLLMERIEAARARG